MTSVPCLFCGCPCPILEPAKNTWGALCDHCIEAQQRHTRAAATRDDRQRQWLALCPPEFRDTQLALLPRPQLTRRALAWQPSPRGLNLWGTPRTGKTRTLFLLLQQLHFAGRRVRFFGPSEFCAECQAREWKASVWVQQLARADIVALDDIDKCTLSRPQEEKFFQLLDNRLRLGLPTFFTGNADGDQLKTCFRRHGDALVARIRECCQPIHFP